MVNWVVTSLVLFAATTVTRSQYLDIFQGLQQLFPPYQQNGFPTQYNAVTRNPSTHRQTNKQESKKKTDDRRHEDRRTKKPSVNQHDLFTTTQKPSRKTTKSNSKNDTRNLDSSKIQYRDMQFGDYFGPYRVNDRNKVKTTTTEKNTNNYNARYVSTDNNPIIENSPSNIGTQNYNREKNIRTTTTERNINDYNTRYINTDNNPILENSPSNIGTQNYNREKNKKTTTTERNINDYNTRYINTDNNPILENSPSNIGTQNYNREKNKKTTTTERNINDYNVRYVNTDNSPIFDNSPSNIGTQNYNREKPKKTTTTERNINDYNTRNINTNNNPIFENSPSNTGTQNYNIEKNSRITPVDYNNRVTNENRGNKNNFNTNQESPIYYPSDNPYINRPGVKPAPVDVGQPPITNKPLNDGSNLVYPTNGFSTYTERPDTVPEILIGPDEDDMSEGQKRRYIELSERMCDRYKALTVKKVVALPLVPSPNAVELNVSSCTPITVPLVIGGKVVSIKEFPHMALVGWMKTRNFGYSWKCGGSLISNQYVLTAGHCTYQDKDYDAVSGPPQAVQLGSSYLDDSGALVVKVESVIRHPKYKQRRSYHDVALIKMVSKVTFSEVVRPACLGVPPPEGDNIIATGWGRTEFGGDHSEELRSVSLPVWNMEECREIWGTSRKLPNGPTRESHLCAGEKRGGKDTCQGDSGGPAQLQDGCAWRVVAVTSFGRSCGAPHTPALYAVIPRAFVAAQVFA